MSASWRLMPHPRACGVLMNFEYAQAPKHVHRIVCVRACASTQHTYQEGALIFDKWQLHITLAWCVYTMIAVYLSSIRVARICSHEWFSTCLLFFTQPLCVHFARVFVCYACSVNSRHGKSPNNDRNETCMWAYQTSTDLTRKASWTIHERARLHEQLQVKLHAYLQHTCCMSYKPNVPWHFVSKSIHRFKTDFERRRSCVFPFGCSMTSTLRTIHACPGRKSITSAYV